MKKFEFDQKTIENCIYYFLEGYNILEPDSDFEIKFNIDEEIKAEVLVKED